MKQRILMQEADGSPGSGSNPSAPAPTEPQAQGAAANAGAPTVDVAAIASAVRDAVFADLRRSGVLGKEKPKAKDEPAPQANLRALDRAVARHPHAPKLNDAAYSRLERAFADESPSDAGLWLKDYFEGMGIAESATPAVTVTATPAPLQRNGPPLNGGTPPAPKPDLENTPILDLSQADRDHLIKLKGPKWYLDKLAEQNRGKSVRLR